MSQRWFDRGLQETTSAAAAAAAETMIENVCVTEYFDKQAGQLVQQALVNAEVWHVSHSGLVSAGFETEPVQEQLTAMSDKWHAACLMHQHDYSCVSSSAAQKC